MSDSYITFVRESEFEESVEFVFRVYYRMVSKGYKGDWSDPGWPPEYELSPPEGVELTPEEEDYILGRISDDIYDYSDGY